MAKLATLAAILGVLLVLSHAVAANHATITTVDIDEPENQRRRGGSCYEQAERLNHCEQLFEDVMRYGGRQYGGDQYGYGGDQYGSQGDQYGGRGSRRYGGDQYGSQGDQYGGQGSRRYGGQGSGQFGGQGQGQCSSQELRQSRHFRPCCQELRRLDDQCQSEGLREVIRRQLGGSGGQGSQQDERRCERNLQNLCGLGRSRDDRYMGY